MDYARGIYKRKLRELKSKEQGFEILTKAEAKRRMRARIAMTEGSYKKRQKEKEYDMSPLTQPRPKPEKPQYAGVYKPYKRPKGKHPTIFDDPPEMTLETRKVFDDMSRRIREPARLGLTPDKIGFLLRYCAVQAWLMNQNFDTMVGVMEREDLKGNIRAYGDPAFTNWLQASRHLGQLHRMLFTAAKVAVPKEEEPEDDGKDVIREKDFPKSLRDSAVAAAQLTEGHDMSELIPFGVRIGDKIKKRA